MRHTQSAKPNRAPHHYVKPNSLCLSQVATLPQSTDIDAALSLSQVATLPLRSAMSTGKAIMKHGARSGGKFPSEYAAWVCMRQRCRNPKHAKYRLYGARGITICPEWETFEQFIKDMGLKPSPELSLDRIDNNGNYEPSNCRWATSSQQNRNRREVITEATVLTIKHLALQLNHSEIARRYGVHHSTISRIVNNTRHAR